MTSDPRAIPDAVQWHEGMLLSPQHFQIAAHRAESLVAYHLATARPMFWGVHDLRIDRSTLGAGVFRVDALEAVLPDGLLVCFDQGEARDGVLELPLSEEAADRATGTLTVHLAVATGNRSISGSGGRARFRSVPGSMVTDDNTGDDPIQVPRLRPLITLAATAGPHLAPAGRMVSLPLARLTTAEQGWALDPDYESPRPVVRPGMALHARVTETLRAVRARAHGLADRLRAQKPEDGEAPPGETLRAARSLTRILPRLEAALAAGAAHPLELFLALCDAVGELASLGPAPAPPDLPAYDHLDPMRPYGAALLRMEETLRGLREPFRTIRFEREREGHFTLTLRRDWLAETLLVGARLAPGQAPDRVAAWMQGAIIASAGRMRAAVENRTRGADRSLVAQAPEIGLVPSPRVLLGRVSVDTATILPEEPLLVVTGTGTATSEPPQALLLFLPAQEQPTPPGGDGGGGGGGGAVG